MIIFHIQLIGFIMKNSDKINLVQIRFWLNGEPMVQSIPPGMTVLEMLNNKLGMNGTKSSCNEGDCGACTVVIGESGPDSIVYQTINSCLYSAFRLHGKHLITVEGISGKDELHAVQTALLDEHGTQCGFCTPGFVMSLLGLFLNIKNPSEEEILAYLEGNLCRCTGYDSIMKAANLLKTRLKTGKELLPPKLKSVENSLRVCTAPIVFNLADNPEGWETRNCFIPTTLSELWHNLKTCSKEDSYKFLAGGTDLMVLSNIQHIRYANLIDLSHLQELNFIRIEKSKLLIGGNVTLSALQTDQLIARHFPLLLQAIRQIASRQIRNSATLAGNIANASPIADGATVLMALQAEMVLASPRGERALPLSQYYHGYKQTELKNDEIIKAIALPLPDDNKHFYNFIKSAKRKAVDISGVVSAVDISSKNGRIEKAVISFGGVAPYPALAVKTMAHLKNRQLDIKLIEEAAEFAASEFKPISDVRGTEKYRSILIKNHIIKHLNGLLDSADTAVRRKK